jgi:hypothetical protein
MGSSLHRSARTTPRIRAELQASQASTRALAATYGLNPKTVAKWRQRSATADARMGPRRPHAPGSQRSRRPSSSSSGAAPCCRSTTCSAASASRSRHCHGARSTAASCAKASVACHRPRAARQRIADPIGECMGEDASEARKGEHGTARVNRRAGWRGADQLAVDAVLDETRALDLPSEVSRVEIGDEHERVDHEQCTCRRTKVAADRDRGGGLRQLVGNEIGGL